MATRTKRQEPEAEAGEAEDGRSGGVEAKLEELGKQLEELSEQLDELAEQGQRLRGLADRLEASAPEAEDDGPEAEEAEGEGLRDRVSVPDLPAQTSALVAAGLGLAGAALFLAGRRLLPSGGSGPTGGEDET